MKVKALIKGVRLEFETDPVLFSADGVDRGSSLLLSRLKIEPNDKILDLGCGYGLIGIYAAKLLRPGSVYMIDNDPLAVRFAALNAQINGVTGVHVECSDGFTNFSGAGFTKILCNPPHPTDFSLAKHFIEKGFDRLAIGGALWMVAKREKWYRNKLTRTFGGVRVLPQGSHCLFQAIKGSARLRSAGAVVTARSDAGDRRQKS